MRARLVINVAAVTLAIALVGAPQALADAPTVTGLTPANGPAAGGNPVTITGSGFIGATAVNFGATDATFTVDDDGSITATAPAGTAGSTVDVTVTNATAETSATGTADQYTYFPVPTVTSLSPPHGPAAGGTSVTITGSGFSGATAVNFDATPATGFTINNATQITATAPAGTGGSTVDVTVTTPAGTSSTSGAGNNYSYDVPAPTVTALNPTHGPAAGGNSVTITGTNLIGATVVHFGASNATNVNVVNSTTVTATAPGGTGGSTVNVTATTPGGTSSTSGTGNNYFYDVPSVTTLVPNHGSAAGGYQVTIGGTEFTGATSVKFGTASASAVNVVNDVTITVNAPAGTAGSTVDVTVVTPNGTSPTAGTANDFSYDPILPPTVTGLSPTHGPATGGNQVTITGTGFAGTTAVKFGANNASSVQVLNNATITVNAPAGAGMSTVDVTVTTPVGFNPSAGTGNDYSYDQAPVVAQRPVPDTFLTQHPKHRTHRRQVAFAFSSDMPGISYQCLFAQGWAKCSSPHTFRHLKPGRYKFQVKAIVNGVEDPTPASWTFRVRR